MIECKEGQQLFRVFRLDQTGWKLVCATDEDRAMKRFKTATGARPVHPSSYWQEQRAAGKYPVRGRRVRRRS